MATSGRKKGGQKTGGRRLGTPNKSTLSFRETLDRLEFDVAEEAVKLFREWTLPPNLQLQLLEMLASYAHRKPKPEGDETSDPLAEIISMTDDQAIRLVTSGDDEAEDDEAEEPSDEVSPENHE